MFGVYWIMQNVLNLNIKNSTFLTNYVTGLNSIHSLGSYKVLAF